MCVSPFTFFSPSSRSLCPVLLFPPSLSLSLPQLLTLHLFSTGTASPVYHQSPSPRRVLSLSLSYSPSFFSLSLRSSRVCVCAFGLHWLDSTSADTLPSRAGACTHGRHPFSFLVRLSFDPLSYTHAHSLSSLSIAVQCRCCRHSLCHTARLLFLKQRRHAWVCVLVRRLPPKWASSGSPFSHLAHTMSTSVLYSLHRLRRSIDDRQGKARASLSAVCRPLQTDHTHRRAGFVGTRA